MLLILGGVGTGYNNSHSGGVAAIVLILRFGGHGTAHSGDRGAAIAGYNSWHSGATTNSNFGDLGLRH